MFVEVPDADVVDRITILELKVARLPRGRADAERELAVLQAAWAAQSSVSLEALAQLEGLRRVNAALWQVEDDLRDLEARRDFGPTFVELARSVYRLNDERAALKLAINEAVGSTLVERKSYGASGLPK